MYMYIKKTRLYFEIPHIHICLFCAQHTKPCTKVALLALPLYRVVSGTLLMIYRPSPDNMWSLSTMDQQSQLHSYDFACVRRRPIHMQTRLRDGAEEPCNTEVPSP